MRAVFLDVLSVTSSMLLLFKLCFWCYRYCNCQKKCYNSLWYHWKLDVKCSGAQVDECSMEKMLATYVVLTVYCKPIEDKLDERLMRRDFYFWICLVSGWHCWILCFIIKQNFSLIHTVHMEKVITVTT